MKVAIFDLCKLSTSCFFITYTKKLSVYGIKLIKKLKNQWTLRGIFLVLVRHYLQVSEYWILSILRLNSYFFFRPGGRMQKESNWGILWHLFWRLRHTENPPIILIMQQIASTSRPTLRFSYRKTILSHQVRVISAESYTDKQAKTGRPVSPHVTIYRCLNSPSFYLIVRQSIISCLMVNLTLCFS